MESTSIFVKVGFVALTDIIFITNAEQCLIYVDYTEWSTLLAERSCAG